MNTKNNYNNKNMDIFEKEFNVAISPEDLNESNINHPMEEEMENSINNSNGEQNAILTSNSIPNSIENPHQINQRYNKELPCNLIENSGLITENNERKTKMFIPILINSIDDITKDQTKKKKRGRRKKDSPLTGGHTGNFPGNILRKNGTAFMRFMYAFLNNICVVYKIKTLTRINFAKQFGYNIDNEYFIKQKLYKILRYKNRNNQKVIKEMTERKDEVFMSIINCTFEYLYTCYIKKKNEIVSNKKDTDSKSFDTLSEMDIIKESFGEFNKNWTGGKFMESSKNLLKEVNGEGDLKKRSRRNENKVPCDYEEVKEIENFFKD